jgi:hypothetical protein
MGVVYLRLIIFLVIDNIPIDSDALLMIDFINLKIKSIRLLKVHVVQRYYNWHAHSRHGMCAVNVWLSQFPFIAFVAFAFASLAIFLAVSRDHLAIDSLFLYVCTRDVRWAAQLSSTLLYAYYRPTVPRKRLVLFPSTGALHKHISHHH